MNRDEAIELLKSGRDGVSEWYLLRMQGEDIPDLNRADLSRASLYGANLSGADLRRADLINANLSGADLSQAACASTSFGDVDLSEVKGLESIKHYGPSTVGIDTLFRSGGKIPDVFLRHRVQTTSRWSS